MSDTKESHESVKLGRVDRKDGFPDEIYITSSGKKTSWLGTYSFLTKYVEH